MNKEITQKQIEVVLQTVYQTNISASTFDSLKKFLSDLPDITPVKKEETVN